jgi:hypothetical protein
MSNGSTLGEDARKCDSEVGKAAMIRKDTAFFFRVIAM